MVRRSSWQEARSTSRSPILLAVRLRKLIPISRRREAQRIRLIFAATSSRCCNRAPFFRADEQFGALLFADGPDIQELERFSAGDPFVIHGIYRDIEILRWSCTIA